MDTPTQEQENVVGALTAETRLGVSLAQKLLYGSTIFIGAFLLFQVQPIIARIILPWFGGSATVWSTCMLFFQMGLLLGYLYAHFLTRALPRTQQAIVHGVLLVVSLALCSVVPDAAWKPQDADFPTVRIVALLTASIGLPYLLLSSTSPLIQAWYARRFTGALPYRYFALSNLASMLALLSYPTLVEPWLTSRQQAAAWTGAYVAYVVLCVAIAWTGRKRLALSPAWTRAGNGLVPASPALPGESSPELRERFAPESAAFASIGPPSGMQRITWLALAACSSYLLLAVTNHITQNVAPVPFLWILPLSLYLLSFILCFDGRRWYRHGVFVWLHAAALVAMGLLVLIKDASLAKVVVMAGSAALFFSCMYFHGELASRKPPARYLTEFYLMIAVGGALGGVLVGVVAPNVLSGHFELSVGLVACAVVTLAVELPRPFYYRSAWVANTVVLATIASLFIQEYSADNRAQVRNFYGALRVFDTHESETGYDARELLHGTIMHGMQLTAPNLQSVPTTYYAKGTGVQLAIDSFTPPRRLGIIGLGTGTLAAYGRAGDYIRFYELNPLVLDIARDEFTFIDRSPANIEFAVGDGRLSLEREAPQNFDVLAVDAFSGDSIPVHMLSREAVQLYFQHLQPRGILAIHISNQVLNLAPVVERIAASLGKHAVAIESDSDRVLHRSACTWALLANHPEDLSAAEIQKAASELESNPRLRVWTDDYSNLFQIIE